MVQTPLIFPDAQITPWDNAHLKISHILLLVNLFHNTHTLLPMNNSTPTNDKSTKMNNLKTKLIRPSNETILFLQMFARTYQPSSVAASY